MIVVGGCFGLETFTRKGRTISSTSLLSSAWPPSAVSSPQFDPIPSHLYCVPALLLFVEGSECSLSNTRYLVRCAVRSQDHLSFRAEAGLHLLGWGMADARSKLNGHF